MLILNEGPEKILSDTLLAKNKLTNMKKQLEILLQKKIRLDNEILILKKSISKKNKSLTLKLKTSIALEAFNPEEVSIETRQEFLQRELPEVVPLFIELDQLTSEISELIQELDED